MIVRRICVLVGLFAVVALALVWLRAEQTRCAADTLRMRQECVTLRRSLWKVQTVAARLRAPERMHNRMGWFRTDLLPPMTDEPSSPPLRLVARLH